MPKAPLPAPVAELFARPNPAVVAVLMPGGAPMSVATWYLITTKALSSLFERRRSAGFLEKFWNSPSLVSVESQLSAEEVA